MNSYRFFSFIFNFLKCVVIFKVCNLFLLSLYHPRMVVFRNQQLYYKHRKIQETYTVFKFELLGSQKIIMNISQFIFKNYIPCYNICNGDYLILLLCPRWLGSACLDLGHPNTATLHSTFWIFASWTILHNILIPSNITLSFNQVIRLYLSHYNLLNLIHRLQLGCVFSLTEERGRTKPSVFILILEPAVDKMANLRAGGGQKLDLWGHLFRFC